jgi:hypothetical protein
MAISFVSSSETEALDNKDILYEDQINQINQDIDLKIIDTKSNKLLGFVISNSPIFILTKDIKFDTTIAHAFLDYKSVENLFCYYRGDVYPVDIHRDYLYPLNKFNQEEYLLEKRIEYEHSFGITSSDVSALYSLSSAGNEKAKSILNWLNDIRNMYFDKVQNMNDAKYYDYNYDCCNTIPYTLPEVFNETPAPIIPVNIKYLYAINETWQSHAKNDELIIIWDNFIRCDDIYSIFKVDLNKEEYGYNTIKINYNGYIKISYKINMVNAEYNRVQPMCFLTKNSEIINDSIAYSYMRSKKYICNATAMSNIILSVKDGDEIQLHSKIAYNSTKFGFEKKVSTIWNQSSLMIETI